ncbi:MAG: hypothetical protein HQL01_11495 [Nitrospirae bacterium]|nr:hypothetical protein [Nitrospirota bacterium]
MLVPTEEFLRAVALLSRQPEWEAIRQWFHRQHILQSYRNNIQREDTLLRMGQGKAQCLYELTKLLTPEFASRGLESLKAENTAALTQDESLKFTAFY